MSLNYILQSNPELDEVRPTGAVPTHKVAGILLYSLVTKLLVPEMREKEGRPAFHDCRSL